MGRRLVVGDRFGRLTVVCAAYGGVAGSRTVACRCDCGSEISSNIRALRRGEKKSCGCILRDVMKEAARRRSAIASTKRRKTGRTKHPLYRIWVGMIERCCNPKRKEYIAYGGRGISVCDRWRTFENFIEDMGERPLGTTIDRIDNDLGYSPENCRWASRKEQLRNTRRKIVVEYKGRRVGLAELCEEMKVLGKYRQILNRIYLGWPAEKALSTPFVEKPHRKFVLDGRRGTLSEWGKWVGIHPSVLSGRLRLGWGFRKAVRRGPP